MFDFKLTQPQQDWGGMRQLPRIWTHPPTLTGWYLAKGRATWGALCRPLRRCVVFCCP